ncbi:spermatogenesis-associated protein 1 isoform X2 [Scyliorhinus canicula]|uniref:spermatogenesis-associated protein 1 isoform X2 n=1 Tax=Scyliorhinus canicula TaxID=7830 RepID=UPI0018F617C9|nr:spermatogenesis-associated protein 1 isoform X2 [Scyliorhinus canicula]
MWATDNKKSRGPHSEPRMTASGPPVQFATAGVKVLELHVFYVPADLWNCKLNTVSNHTINKFISAGFVRVLPDLCLKAVRQQIGELLGAHPEDDKFVFLKCVGRSLAVVRPKQELEIKVKSFAPPYAPQPELYLLPGACRRPAHRMFTPERQQTAEEDFGTSASHPRLITRDLDENEPSGELKSPGSSYQAHVAKSPEIRNGYMSCDRLQNTNCEENAKPKDCKSDDFPHNLHRNRSPDITNACSPLRQRTPNPGGTTDSRQFEANALSQEAQRTRSPGFSNSWEQETPSKSLRNARQSNQKIARNQQQEHPVCQRKKETAAMGVAQMDMTSVAKENRILSNSTRDSGIPESLDERDLEYYENQRKKSQQVNQAPESISAGQGTNQTQNDGYSPVANQYSLPPPPPLLTFNLKSQLESVPTDKEQLTAEINATKQERKCLEKTREELVKKAKGLLSQNRLRRNQVRDKWKKKYFESKKVTIPLEETSSKLRQELETYYLKLLHQLEARDTRKQDQKSTSNSKNELIIQITTLKHEIDQLYRSVENAKMKLITEIKLRKQTSTELRVLRAELAQKKTQSSLNRLHGGSVPHSLNAPAS